MSLHKKSNVELTNLKGCDGCRRRCQYRSLVSVDGGNSEKFTCNSVVRGWNAR